MIQEGDRIELIAMADDPRPIPTGTKGTVTFINPVNLGGGDRFTQYSVKWDDGRSLMPCVPPDTIRKI